MQLGRLLCTLVPVAISLFGQAPTDPPRADSARGDFFIVSSVDLSKRQILMKRPTEVTELMSVDNQTRYFDEHGKSIRLGDLRAGDTVFIVSKSNGGQKVAGEIHKGAMTLDVLRERYLKGSK